MKRCRKCGIDKPAVEFYASNERANGLQYWCKACQKIRRAIYYATHRERNREHEARKYRTFRAKWPDKIAASNAVTNAVRDGRLSRQPCFCCGIEPAEAHHASYAPEMRLAVTWLCRPHHKQLHKEVTT